MVLAKELRRISSGPQIGAAVRQLYQVMSINVCSWKISLLQKWKDSNMLSNVAYIDMDPNLMVAYITYNVVYQHLAHISTWHTFPWH
jgi:hypothetical protein